MTTDKVSATTADHLAIRSLLDRYTDALNHREFALLGDLFTTDAAWETRGPMELRFEGAKTIAASIEGLIAAMDILVQSTCGVVIKLQGDRASVRSSIQEFGRQKSNGAGMHTAGSYYDDVVKSDGEWRFKRRVFCFRYADEAPVPGHVFESRP